MPYRLTCLQISIFIPNSSIRSLPFISAHSSKSNCVKQLFPCYCCICIIKEYKFAHANLIIVVDFVCFHARMNKIMFSLGVINVSIVYTY